jgi:NAD-dependent deacetylase
MRCLNSKLIFDISEDLDFDTQCRCCRSAGNLRPHVVWFGEMPFHMNQINNALESCDLFVAIGTSGNVYPASGFYQTAKIRRAHTWELNLEETGSSFDTHVYGPATETVPQFFEKILQPS